MSDSDDPLYQLVMERLERFEAAFEARFKLMEMNVEHFQKLNEQQAATFKADLAQLRKDLDDHESRLRTLTESAVTFRTRSNLFSGGSLAASLTALLRAFFGGG